MNFMKTFCVIPAYNEEKRLGNVLKDVKNFVDEVVVVDDCSSDNTSEIARQAGVVLLRHVINRDQGAALRTGTEYALDHGADIIVHFDADGQFLPEDIEIALDAIKSEGYEVVLGSRFMGKESNMPLLKKKIFYPLARLVNFLILGVKLTDPQSGFRVLSRKAAMKIKIEQRGKAHCSEILYKILKLKLRVKEVPITVIYHEFGQNFSGGVRIVKDLILARLID